MPEPIPDDATAESLISGKLKKSPSYHGDYGNITYADIKRLAKQGDLKARQMKKLIEQRRRLDEKPPDRRGH